jgi:hypothetical protein
MAMNERTYLNAVLALPNLSDELKEETNARLDKMNAKNEKRKTMQTKTQKENEPIAKAIVEALANGGMLGLDLAKAIGQTPNKTNGVAGNLVNEGVLIKTKVKVKGKGDMAHYELAPTDEVEEADEVDEVEETAEETAED